MSAEIRPHESVPALAHAGPRLRLLTVLIVLILGIPSILIFSPLGSAGTPADVLGLVMLVIWMYQRIATSDRDRRRNPIRVAMLLFLASIVASYLAASTRPISSIELSAADRGLLSAAAWLGIVLLAIDGPHTLSELDILMRRLVLAGSAVATVGLAQFVTKLQLVNYIQIPGLQDNTDLAGTLVYRGTLARPSATAIHPIEFGAVLTMILPFALHYALSDVHRSYLVRWFPVVTIAVATPISISRSAILSATVGMLFMLPTWPVAVRRRSYAAIIVLFGGLYVAVPGLVGTLRALFTGVSTDNSAASRTDSYGLAFQFISRSPLFGRGFRTFLPEYRILDNQLLGTTIDVGFVGLAALLGLMATGIVCGLRIHRRRELPGNTRQLGQAFAASIAAAICGFALYDALSFPMASCVCFLVLGCCGALHRLVAVESPSHQQ